VNAALAIGWEHPDLQKVTVDRHHPCAKRSGRGLRPLAVPAGCAPPPLIDSSPSPPDKCLKHLKPEALLPPSETSNGS
jgi:hypothetical protein